MQLIFEKSVPGRGTTFLPPLDVPAYSLSGENLRKEAPKLPEVSEVDLVRHYQALADRAFGVVSGFYPLGSCTMKYNPAANNAAAALEGFAALHPLAGEENAQGALAVLHDLTAALCKITGMTAGSLAPAAGAQGEFAGLLMIKAYHESRGQTKTKILVPDSAHGTNPATASMAGFSVVSIPSGADGRVDLAALKEALDDDIAGIMLTNPNTLGLFEKDILEITRLVKGCGGLCYYDGANLNALVGAARPGDMGFDVCHLNLHKTFSTPHGGGGPGSGPVLCSEVLQDFLPFPVIGKKEDAFRLETPPQSIGRLGAFYGNFLVALRAYAYVLRLGGEGLLETAQNAVLNANYMRQGLADLCPSAFPGLCMHEFVLSLEDLKKQTGVSALDVAKALIDFGMHPPTVYFPLIVKEALMIEPTETEGPEGLDEAVAVYRKLFALAEAAPEKLKNAPVTAAIGRPDETTAARKPIVRFQFPK